jgi:hypothetical protein
MDAETIAREPLPVHEDLVGRRKKSLWSHEEVRDPRTPVSPHKHATPSPPLHAHPRYDVTLTRVSVSPISLCPQDQRLRSLVESAFCKSWRDVAQQLPDRTEIECFRRWQKVVNPSLKKGGWTPDEDKQIIELVEKYGAKRWSVIASHLPGRIDKQCRERYVSPSPLPYCSPLFKGLIADSSDVAQMQVAQPPGPEHPQGPVDGGGGPGDP